MAFRLVTVLSSCLAALLLSTAVAQPLPTGAIRLAPERYEDVAIQHWAADALRRLSNLGVLTGYPDGTFRGQEAATRFELAVVAARIVDLLGETLAELALDPTFWEEFGGANQVMRRLDRLERAAEQSASLESAAWLDSRLAAVEGYLNELAGEELFPDPAQAAEELPRSPLSDLPPLPEEEPGERPNLLTGRLPAGQAGAGAAQGDAGAGAFTASGEDIVQAGQRRPLDLWIGVAAGYPQAATVHLGLHELWGRLSLRAGVHYDARSQFGIEVSGIDPLPVAADSPALPYFAAGPVLVVGERGSGAGLQALAGLEIPLGRSFDEQGFLYFEAGPEVIFRDGVENGLMGRFGLGYRF